MIHIQYDSLFKTPIFILSPPRSGSTMLFEALWRFGELHHLGHESDPIWWECFPYEKMLDPGDYVGKEQLSDRNIEALRNSTFKALVKTNVTTTKSPIRFVDKTIANCFHLDFIEKAFPTAQYIFLVRDPRDNISSMLEGWPYVDRFGKAQLTPIISKIEGATISHWTYPAPPSWQKVVTRPLPEICAWSWQQHIDYVLEFFRQRKRNYLLIRYEDLLTDAIAIFTDLSQKLRLEMTDNVLQYIKNPSLSSTTVSEPEANKWKRKHYDEIVSILPMIEGTAKKIGYDISR